MRFLSEKALAMKKVLLVGALLCAPAFADESPFKTGEALAAEVASRCGDGCIVLTPAEAELLTHSINQMVREREQRAFEAGFGKGSKSCRNAI